LRSGTEPYRAWDCKGGPSVEELKALHPLPDADRARRPDIRSVLGALDSVLGEPQEIEAAVCAIGVVIDASPVPAKPE
jgi:hypothetical protein